MVDAAPGRVLVVVVTMCIEDGTVRPAVGQDVDYPLTFVETDDPDDELGARWTVEAEPLRDGPERSRPLGGPEYGPPYWSVLLHGPGWSATWHAPRPVAGTTTLHGRLHADLLGGGRADASVRGRIERLWVISQTIDRSDGNRNDVSRIVPGSLRLDPVSVSPRWFDRGHGRPGEHPPAPPEPGQLFVFVGATPPPAPWVYETGVLADVIVA